MTDRRLILRTWIRALDHFELVPLEKDKPSFLGQIAYARNGFIDNTATDYERTGHIATHRLVSHRQKVRDTLASQYRLVIPYFARTALRGIKSRRIERKAVQGIYDALVAEWIAREAVRKAKLIADTDRDDVVAAIQGGLNEGLGTAEIARNIRKVSSLTPFRAATVARTETHAAATFGSVESVRQAERDLGVTMVKEWLATKDDRTRPEHAAADGQRVAMDEKFTVGGELMDRPGDPSATPDMLINCRCAMVYEEKSE